MIRWTWFAALLLAAAGYLLSGLSQPETTPRAAQAAPLRATAARSVDRSGSIDADLAAAITRLNDARQQHLQTQGLQSAPQADWLTRSRRMSLALVGTGVSLQEIRQLEAIPPDRRVAAHLDRLLGSDRFAGYWGERWTRFLVGADDGPFVVFRRRRFRTWLAERFAENEPYDRLVRRLITATGLWTDRPEVNFYTVTYDSGDDGPDPVRLAARTSRAFLGLRIDCLQCHDDFLGNVSLGDVASPRSGLQTDFHGLAAFFTAAKANGLQGIQEGDVDYRYQYLHATEQAEVPAVVPYSPELLPADGPMRQRLAVWITSPQNRQAARSGVSHVWALMFGRPIGDAVDNLPLDQTPNPMLEVLVDDFIANGFDLRRLIRLIAMSDAFAVDSRGDFEITPRHEQHTAVFPLTRLRPEQIAGAMMQSARIKTTDRDSAFLTQLQTFGQTNDFVYRYGDLGEDEFDHDNTTISQRLVMLNGELMQDSTTYNPIQTSSAHLTLFSPDDPALISNAYLCVLNRFPTDAEREHFVSRFAEAGDEKKSEVAEDLFWVLLNSSEFAWNH